MNVLKSFIIAFAMYSKIPMPFFNWKDEDMKYIMCFFPLIGVVIGTIEVVWFYLCRIFNVGALAYTLIAIIIPAVITGGIHIDGYMDTCDALSSYRDKETKLEILKDSHIGAFCVIKLFILMCIYGGAFSEIKNINQIFILGLGFYLSRLLSALLVVTLKAAKNNGTLFMFKDKAHEKVVKFWIVVQLLICFCGIGYFSFNVLCLVIISGLLWIILYKNIAYKNFGGITGDTAGYFLTVFEVLVAFIISLAGFIF